MFNIIANIKSCNLIDGVEHQKFDFVIGEDIECFLSPLCYWSANDYLEHWHVNLKRILIASEKCSFLISEIYDPSKANYLRWWPMYKVGGKVIFQDNILFFEDSETDYLGNLEHFVPNRETINEEGEIISEWVVEVESIEKYLSTIQ